MEPETRLLAGPAYSLLRKPFLKAAKSKNPALNLDRLFLNMGGADLANDTLQLLKQLNTINSFFSEVNIVVGAGYQFLDSLYDQINEKSGYYIHRNLTAEQMSALMQTCGVAICPPSGVSYEYCTAKGILFLKQTAGNQTGIFDFLITSRLALPFSEFDNYISQPELMRSTAVALITNQARIFDGKAPDRFKAYFKSL